MPKPAQPAQPTPVVLRGNAGSAKAELYLERGTVRVNIVNRGSGYLGVGIGELSTGAIDMIYLASGYFAGTKTYEVRSAGTFFVVIQGDDEWQVILSY